MAIWPYGMAYGIMAYGIWHMAWHMAYGGIWHGICIWHMALAYGIWHMAYGYGIYLLDGMAYGIYGNLTIWHMAYGAYGIWHMAMAYGPMAYAIWHNFNMLIKYIYIYNL